MGLAILKIDSNAKRALLMVAAVAFIAGAAFAAIWGMANTASSQAETIEEAELMVWLAPADPQTHFALAVLLDRSFEPADFERALAHYERAAALGPDNYLLWLEVGHARERRGDAARAESALRRAAELAPHYAAVRWALGNALLRQARADEAFAEIRSAVAGEAKYTATAADLAWRWFEGDMTAVRGAVGDSVRLNASLANILAKEERYDEAADIWERLPEADKRSDLSDAGAALLAKMIAAKRYRPAVRIASQLTAGGETPEVGHIVNGGFEDAVRPDRAGPFEWGIGKGSEPQIVPTNGRKRSGDNSLAMVFNGSARDRAFRRFAQTIAVEPGRSYTLRVHYFAELNGNAKLQWTVKSAKDGTLLASTGEIANAADWSELTAHFTATADGDGVVISVERDKCAFTACSLAGTVWFDDISMTAE